MVVGSSYGFLGLIGGYALQKLLATLNWQAFFHCYVKQVSPAELFKAAVSPTAQVLFLTFALLASLVPKDTLRFWTHFQLGLLLGLTHVALLGYFLKKELREAFETIRHNKG